MSDVHHAKRTQRQTRKWWQWLLLYPTIAVAFLGAIPQYTSVVKAYFYDVPVKQVSSAETQYALWKKNAECITATPTTQVTIQEHISVAASACASRDVLVSIKYPGEGALYRWIPFTTQDTTHDEVSQLGSPLPSKTSVLGEPEANGDTSSDVVLVNLLFQALRGSLGHPEFSELGGPAQSEQKVICQRWLSGGRLLRRVRESDKCFDEIVNTYTGKVEERKPADCDPHC